MPHELNPCNWPDCGGWPSARQLLDEIAGQAEADALQGIVPRELLMWILDVTYRCKSPFLFDLDGMHVCEVGTDEAWLRLVAIWKKTDPGFMEQTPGGPEDAWWTIAQELENFPTAVPLDD